MEVVRKLINDLLAADKLGKQRVATDNLIKGIEHYTNQRVIDELESFLVGYDNPTGEALTEDIQSRIKELKQD